MMKASALLVLLVLSSPAHSEFTQKDRELIVSLKVKMEEIDKRFEQIDKRLDELRQDMNARFELIQNILVAMFGVFGGLCAVFVGLLIWDRRTFKEKTKEEALREVEEKSKLVEALRRFAKVEPKMAEVLRSLGL